MQDARDPGRRELDRSFFGLLNLFRRAASVVPEGRLYETGTRSPWGRSALGGGFGQMVRSAPDMPDQVARARGPAVSLAVGAGALAAAAWLILAGHRLLAGVAALVGAVATLGPEAWPPPPVT